MISSYCIFMTCAAGLNLFGQALEDFKVTLVQCNETEIVKLLDGFIQDLVSCTESKSLLRSYQ